MKKYISIEEYLKQESISKEKSNLKVYKYILIILCLSIILFALYNLVKWNIDNFKIKKINDELEKNINLNVKKGKGELVNPPINRDSSYYYYASFPFYQANFSSLLSKNSDTVAYIYMKNTIINYPIVQSNDNNYYLKHSFDKKDNNAGWIFMDYRNNINYLSDNTIIYGHARLDGTLFGSLRNVLLSSWQKNQDNYAIFLSTLKENMIFQIFSIYTIDRENYYIMTDFSNNKEKQEWINIMKKRNIAPINTEVNVNDKFLTLSTCKNNQGERIVVQAKLIKRQKNKR